VNAAPPLVHPCHTRFSPVFVLGHARSGTSLVCRLLLDHLGINFGTESQFIVRYQQKLSRYGDLSDDSRLRWLLEDIGRERFFARTRRNFGFVLDVERALMAASPRTYAGALRAIFEQFAAGQGHVRWGDKTPEYCHHLPVIRELFPDAQFLHVVRDGRDVAHSLFATGFGPKNAYEAALAWRKTLEEVRRFRDTLPQGVFTELRYEELVGDPVGTLAGVARFLGVENDAAVMEAVAPRLRVQVRAGSLLKWKQRLSWREIECFEAFAGDQLTALGYPLQFRPRMAGRSPLEAVFWKGQAVVRRVTNRRYWADNWYKLALRARDAMLPLRAFARPRMREAWPAAQRSAK
jgi:sulfotransferase family protein